jgi:hypothetical protein
MSTRKARRPTTPIDGMDVPFPSHLKTIREIDQSAAGGFIGRYRRYRAKWMADSSETVRKQELYCWLFVGPRQVGAMGIYEFEANPFLDKEDFWFVMDAVSHTTMELAEILSSHWEDPIDDVASFGSVIMIHSLWVAPCDAKRGEWAGIVRELLATIYRRRSLLVLKAFPLDGTEDNRDDEVRKRWAFRHRALIRHYGRLLGVKPFPSSWGEEGWLYAIPEGMADLVSEPVYRPELSE